MSKKPIASTLESPDHARLRSVVHREPLSFRELCERVVPAEARFLVLDLDRTVHFNLNLGERLGWELNAAQSYGMDVLRAIEPRRGRKRLVLEPRWPLSMLRFVWLGVTRWTGPGLYYWWWGKQAALRPWLGRIAVRRFGETFMQHAQRATQLTLMRLLAAADPALVAQLAERLWDRHVDDQVITREDLDWLRARNPGLQVILTSASPQVTVETAARKLGVDLAIFSTPERINSGHDKMARMRELRPEVLDPANVSVGMTDTQYGEDYSWAEHLTIVVDINSDWPFPEDAPAGGTLREIHSARVLTRAELARKQRGERNYLDRRRATATA